LSHSFNSSLTSDHDVTKTTTGLSFSPKFDLYADQDLAKLKRENRGLREQLKSTELQYRTKLIEGEKDMADIRLLARQKDQQIQVFLCLVLAGSLGLCSPCVSHRGLRVTGRI